MIKLLGFFVAPLPYLFQKPREAYLLHCSHHLTNLCTIFLLDSRDDSVAHMH